MAGPDASGLPAGQTCRRVGGQRWRAARPGRCSSGRDSVAAPCSRQSSGSPCVRGGCLSFPQPVLQSQGHAERSALLPPDSPPPPCKIKPQPLAELLALQSLPPHPGSCLRLTGRVLLPFYRWGESGSEGWRIPPNYSLPALPTS